MHPSSRQVFPIRYFPLVVVIEEEVKSMRMGGGGHHTMVP